jgi:Ca2+-binding EF-hand superfamily protein
MNAMKLLPIVLALTMVPAVALAQTAQKRETPKEFETRFNQADADRSGGLSIQEVQRAAVPGFPAILKNFNAVDANKDGQVTLAERDAALVGAAKANRAQMQQRAAEERKAWEEQFKKADANKDGALTKKEAESAAKPGFPQIVKNFSAMDKDKNGKVTVVERDDYLKAEVKKQLEERQKQGRKVFEDQFAKADANKSGGLSRKEVESAAAPGFPLIKENFDAMDANKDGQVTPKERDEFLKARTKR